VLFRSASSLSIKTLRNPEGRILIDSDEAYSIARFVRREDQEHSRGERNVRAIQQYIRHDIGEMVRRIRAAAPEARVFMIVRNQLDWMRSAYKWAVFNVGVDLPFAAFLDSALGGAFLEAGDYRAVLERYREAFGRERVAVFFFEDLREDLPGFLKRLGNFLQVPFEERQAEDANPNRGRPDLLALLQYRLNRLAERDPSRRENPLYFRLSRYARRYLYPLLTESGLFARSSVLSAQTRNLLAARYAPGNARLAEETGRDLSAMGYPMPRSPGG
jgi:hypothetical protein